MKKVYVCNYCGNIYTVKNKKHKYCSRTCFFLDKLKNTNTERKLIRY